MSQIHEFRAACWEAPMVLHPEALEWIQTKRYSLLSQILWTTGLVENEGIILSSDPHGDLLTVPGSSGEIGALQGTRGWLQDALYQWKSYGSFCPSPSMASLLGQCLGGLYYWDKYYHSETISVPSFQYLERFPAIHNRGPQGLREIKLPMEEQPKILKLYMRRFLHFWQFRETLDTGKIKLIEPFNDVD